MKFTTSDGVELYYEISGNGFPCLYLHGGPGYWSKSFQASNERLLEEDLEIIYLDQRGCGRSQHDGKSDYSLNRLLKDIEELRIFLNINEWYLFGHSFGGILAVNYAVQYSNYSRGLILSNVTLNLFDSFIHQIERGTEILGSTSQDLHVQNRKSIMDIFYSVLSELIERNEYYKLQFLHSEYKRIIDKIDKELNSDPRFQQYVFSSEEFFRDFTPLTSLISEPVLIITGKYDHAVGPDHYKTFQFKNSSIHVLACGHHPYIELKTEFNDTIVNFIKNK